MTACSRNWLLLPLLFVFAVGKSIEYGIGSSIVIFTGIALGVVLTLIVGHLLSKLDEDKLYEDKYYTLGVTITYEYLFGKNGAVRQVYAVFILVSLPVVILTTYISPVSSRQFLLFVVPVDVVSIIMAYCLLKALILNRNMGSRKTYVKGTSKLSLLEHT